MPGTSGTPFPGTNGDKPGRSWGAGGTGLGCSPHDPRTTPPPPGLYSKGGEGGLKGFGGGGGLAGTPPPPRVPLWSPAEGGPKFLKLKSSWHRRRRSKNLAVSLKHYKRRRGGGGGSRGGYPPSSCGVRPSQGITALQPWASKGGLLASPGQSRASCSRAPRIVDRGGSPILS